MLNADDRDTVIALRQLKSVTMAGAKPLVFWIGAGASRWLGYLGWKDFALQLRRTFFQTVGAFDNEDAQKFLNTENFPALFQMCRDLDSALYYRLITDAFRPRPTTDSYRKFVDLLVPLSPTFIVTTNVEESLESRIPEHVIVQKSDLTRCIDLLQSRTPFVAKLHGSTSSVQTTVFASRDYDSIIGDNSYLQTLKYIFASCTVIFLGYGVRDRYVIKLLHEDASERDLFGAGPHFVVTNDTLPVPSLRRIRYLIKLQPDHTAALNILDYIAQSRTNTVIIREPDLEGPKCAIVGDLTVPLGKTAYYISDLIPPGTWQTSEEITAKRSTGGDDIEASFGLGFTNDEVLSTVSPALHDLTVGLVCFDYVYLPFSAITRVAALIGQQLFEELVKIDVVRFIHYESKTGVMFRKGEVMGSLVNVIGGSDKGPQPLPLSDLIRRTLNPVSGREREAEDLFQKLEQRTAVFRREVEIDLPSVVRSSLVMPTISKLLGIGDAILPSQVPRWLRYPYLRLGHLVKTAVLCKEYGIQAAKLPFGGVQLTTATFGIQPLELSADHLASYALSGSFNSDLGAFLEQDMSVLTRIIRFRTSAEGEAFRRETGQVLQVQSGAQFNASVNAGLSRTIPPTILQRARNRMLMLMTERADIVRVPAVWAGSVESDASTRYWRKKSKRLLLEMCAARRIGRNDPCICGSGEKLRLCCLSPLGQ
jgi:hypothetical protein